MITNWIVFFFFFNDTATTEIYTLSLHDALPICTAERGSQGLIVHLKASRIPLNETIYHTEAYRRFFVQELFPEYFRDARTDRKSTRLNSSHGYISYAVFCLKKKKKARRTATINI